MLMWMVIGNPLPAPSPAGGPSAYPQPPTPGSLGIWNPLPRLRNGEQKCPGVAGKVWPGEPGHTHTAPGAQSGRPKGDPVWPVCTSRLLGPLKIGNTWGFKDQHQPALLSWTGKDGECHFTQNPA